MASFEPALFLGLLVAGILIDRSDIGIYSLADGGLESIDVLNPVVIVFFADVKKFAVFLVVHDLLGSRCVHFGDCPQEIFQIYGFLLALDPLHHIDRSLALFGNRPKRPGARVPRLAPAEVIQNKLKFLDGLVFLTGVHGVFGFNKETGSQIVQWLVFDPFRNFGKFGEPGLQFLGLLLELLSAGGDQLVEFLLLPLRGSGPSLVDDRIFNLGSVIIVGCSRHGG